ASGSANSPASVRHWTVDLAARAATILATVPPTFIRFRELMSARGHALLQLFLPVQDNSNAVGRDADRASVGAAAIGQRRHIVGEAAGHVPTDGGLRNQKSLTVG